MAKLKQYIWSNMTIEEDKANALADYFNSKLVPTHQVELVKVTDSGWYMIVGSPQAKAVCDKIMKEELGKADSKPDPQTIPS